MLILSNAKKGKVRLKSGGGETRQQVDMLKNGAMRRQADRPIFAPRAVPLQAEES